MHNRVILLKARDKIGFELLLERACLTLYLATYKRILLNFPDEIYRILLHIREIIRFDIHPRIIKMNYVKDHRNEYDSILFSLIKNDKMI